MLHLKFKPKILPQIVAFMHIKTHQTGEGPHFVTFLNGFHYKMGKPQRILLLELPLFEWFINGVHFLSNKGLLGPVRVWSGSVGVQSGSGNGLVRVQSGSGQGPVTVWWGTGRGQLEFSQCLVGVLLGSSWGLVGVQLGFTQGPVGVRFGFQTGFNTTNWWSLETGFWGFTYLKDSNKSPHFVTLLMISLLQSGELLKSEIFGASPVCRIG